MIILDEVKKALGITGNYMDGILEQYIREVKEYMLDSGIKQNVIESTSAKGLITRGVADLWNYGQGEAKLSDYFKERCIQMANKDYGCGCGNSEEKAGWKYVADLPVVDSLVEGMLFLVEKDRIQKAISSDDISKYFKGPKGDTGNDAEIAGAGAEYEETGAAEPSVIVETSGMATARYFNFVFRDLRGPKGTSVETIEMVTEGTDIAYKFTMNDGTAVTVAAPYIRLADAIDITVDETTGTPAARSYITFETIAGNIVATIHIALTGLKGEKGEKGEKGDTGLTGEKGEKGDIGLTGEKGEKGDTGATGEKGPEGPQGLQGPEGPQGPKGDTYTLTEDDETVIANKVITLLGNAEDSTY